MCMCVCVHVCVCVCMHACMHDQVCMCVIPCLSLYAIIYSLLVQGAVGDNIIKPRPLQALGSNSVQGARPRGSAPGPLNFRRALHFQSPSRKPKSETARGSQRPEPKAALELFQSVLLDVEPQLPEKVHAHAPGFRLLLPRLCSSFLGSRVVLSYRAMSNLFVLC